MSLEWDKSLELGFDEIDNQHRLIFEHFYKLSEATQRGDANEILEEMVLFIFDYAQVHFNTEDKIMVEYEYPEIELQRKEHSEFTRDADEFKNQIEHEGATRELAVKITGKLFRWIIQHIRKNDKEMVEYVKKSIALREKLEGIRTSTQNENYLIGRQPILNRNEEIVAYELLFRSTGSKEVASVNDASHATASVIINTLTGFGLDQILGPHHGFINMELDLLMSDSLYILPKERVVLELLETLRITPELVERCRKLKEKGYILALDDHEFDPIYEELYYIAEIVKIDLILTPPEILDSIVERFRPYPVKMLAEKVETREEYIRCLDLGFEFFQGYYFAKPSVIEKKSVDESQATLLKLMRLHNGDSDLDLIERTFRGSPGLTYKLLMLVNSVSTGMREKIKTVRHAMTILGYQKIKHWIQLSLFASTDNSGHENPLVDMAAVRAAFMEQLANCHPQCKNRQDASEQAFMIGILSFLETIYNISIDEMVENLNLSEEVRVALVSRTGVFGKLLSLAEHVEQMDFKSAFHLFEELGISQEDVLAAQVSAYGWRERL